MLVHVPFTTSTTEIVSANLEELRVSSLSFFKFFCSGERGIGKYGREIPLIARGQFLMTKSIANMKMYILCEKKNLKGHFRKRFSEATKFLLELTFEYISISPLFLKTY